MISTIKTRQATRRKTLMPLTSRDVHRERTVIASYLRNKGHSFYAIRQVMRGTPEEARKLVARGKRRGLVN